MNLSKAWNQHMTKIRVNAWTKAHDRAASVEGWSVFSVIGGSADGEYQIQAFDEPSEDGTPPLLADDGEAYTLCCEKALEGSKLHALALYLDGRKYQPCPDVPKALMP